LRQWALGMLAPGSDGIPASRATALVFSEALRAWRYTSPARRPRSLQLFWVVLALIAWSTRLL